MLMKNLKDELANETASVKIPSELIDLFNKDLPSKLKYRPVDKSTLQVDFNQMESTCNILKHENASWFKKYEKYIKDSNDVLEIMTLTQTPLAIKMDDNIECDGIEIPQDLLFRNISDNKFNEKIKQYICPMKLPSYDFILSIDNDSIEIKTTVQLQRCDNIEFRTFDNYNDNIPFKLSFTVPSRFYEGDERFNVKIAIGVDNSKADNVKEAIDAYKMYRAFMTNKLFLNNTKIMPNNCSKERKKEILKSIDKNIKILTAVNSIEKLLNIKFELSNIFDFETIDIIMKLYISLIRHQAYKESKKINSASFNKKLNAKDIKDDLLNEPSAFITSGTLSINSLGCNIELYYITRYAFVKLVSVENIENEEYKLVFDCTDNQYHASSKIYIDEESMENELMSEKIHEYLEDTVELGNVLEIVTKQDI